MDAFEEFLNSVYRPVTVANISWEAGTVLRKMDPVAFREAYLTSEFCTPDES